MAANPDTAAAEVTSSRQVRGGAAFSQTEAVNPTPDSVLASSGDQEERAGRGFRPASTGGFSFSETSAVAAEPDHVVTASRGHQEERGGRQVTSSSLSFTETAAVAAEADQVVRVAGARGRQEETGGRQVAARPDTSFTQSRAVAAQADRPGQQPAALFQPSAQLQSNQQNLRTGKVLKPDVSMFKPISKSTSFTETEAVVPEADSVHETNQSVQKSTGETVGAVLFEPRPDAKKSRAGRLLHSDRSQTSAFTQTDTILPKPDQDGSNSSDKETTVELFQPRPDAKNKRRGRLLADEAKSSNTPHLFKSASHTEELSNNQKDAKVKKFTFGVHNY